MIKREPKIAIRYDKKAEGKKTTKPAFWMDEKKMLLLEIAFRDGADYSEACGEAGVVLQTFKNALSKKEKLVIIEDGVECECLLSDLVDMWSGAYTMKAKRYIINTLNRSQPNNDANLNAWRILERRKATEWGLRPGVGSVEGGAVSTMNFFEEGKRGLEEAKKVQLR